MFAQGVELNVFDDHQLFAIIFKVETPDGIIQIETNVTDVEIFVDGQKVVYITDPKDKTKIRVEIPKGAETLRVSKEGFEADVSEFKLKTMKGPAIFLAQFAGDEAPYNSLEGLCKWVAGMGYLGVQIPTWDSRLIDLEKAAERCT